MGRVTIRLVQVGQTRGLVALSGCQEELEELGQRWDLRRFRYQPQQVPADRLDQL
jgi:hypothetical protein